MASIINALSSGTGGIVTAGDASGILQLQTANTAAVTIDESQNVGIGTASPGSGVRLDVVGGEIRAGRVDSSYEGGQVSFSRSTDNTTAWYIDVYGNTSTPSFRVVDVSAGAVALALSSSGTLALRGASSSSGVGISFPGTQVTSSDANTLDDYEEGTWTPTFNFSGSSTGITYAWQIGYYTKVGRVVTIQCYIQFGNKGSASGGLRIDGLPFTAISGSGNQAYCASSIWANALSSTVGGFMGFVNPNSTFILPYYSNTGSVTQITNTNCNNNSDFMLNATYVTNI